MFALSHFHIDSGKRIYHHHPARRIGDSLAIEAVRKLPHFGDFRAGHRLKLNREDLCRKIEKPVLSRVSKEAI